MIIIKIHSGLGNQMFQYAFARSLQHKYNVKVLLDTRTYFSNSRYRKYGLDEFNIQLEKASIFQLSQFLSLKELNVNLNNYKGIRRLIIRIWRKLFNEKFYAHYRKAFNTNTLFTDDDSNISNLLNEIHPNKNYYISGYFQNVEYVEHVLPILRSEFSLKSDYLSNTKLCEELAKENSVSIHVRRGDYLNLQDLFSVLEMDYFTKAMNIIKEKLNNPTFYIFSNDKDWVKDNFILDESCYLITEKYSNNECDDLLLMSMCKHHIISNSTFSWWGATLNSNKDKIVIAPLNWYVDSGMNKKTDNFISHNWIRI